MKKLLASLIGISLVISMTGCIFGPRDEKQAFIDATVEATCHIFQAENLFDPALEEEAKEIYKKYGFDADDQEGMQAIATKYAEDEEVKSAIMEQIKKCSEGVPGLEGLVDMAAEGELIEEELLPEDVVLEEGEAEAEAEGEAEGEAEVEVEAEAEAGVAEEV